MSGYQAFEVADPQESLTKLAGLVLKGMELEDFRVAAVTLVKSCLRIRGGSGADKDSMPQSLCELRAIFDGITEGDQRIDWLREGVSYIADPSVFDLFHTPGRIVALCRSGACAFDCLPVDTLVRLPTGLGKTPIGDLRIGDAIWGETGPVRVLSVMQKGVQDTLRFELDHGAPLRCTGDHKVLRFGDHANVEEVRAASLNQGDELLSIEGRSNRVVAIGDGGKTKTVDIMVDGGRFYLPESDTVVHNCDDHVVIAAALAGCVGFKVGLRAWGKEDNELSHVYAVVRVPKVRTRKTLALDTSTGNPRIGWQPPGGHVVTCWIEENGALTWETGTDNDG